MEFLERQLIGLEIFSVKVLTIPKSNACCVVCESKKSLLQGRPQEPKLFVDNSPIYFVSIDLYNLNVEAFCDCELQETLEK